MKRLSIMALIFSQRGPDALAEGSAARLMRLLLLAAGLLMASADASAGCSKPLHYHIKLELMLPFERADLAWFQRVMTRAGCELQVADFATASTSRRLREIEAGTLDLLMNATKLAERSHYAWFSHAYAQEHAQLLARKTELARWRGMDLIAIAAAGGRVSGPLTGWFGEEYERFRLQYSKHKAFVPYVYNLSDGIAALHKNRADVLLVSDRQLQSVNAGTYRGLSILIEDLGGAPVHIMLSKRSVSAADFEQINQAIALVLAEGDRP